MAEQQNPPKDVGVTRLLRGAAVALLLGAALVCNSLEGPDQEGASAPGDSAPPAASPGAPGTESWSGLELPRSRPIRLTIPRLGVDAPFTDLTLTVSGELNAPPADDPNLVGWYRDGVTPGERGTAVVAGHVDTTTGPAVFLLLRMLRKGDTVNLLRADGTTAVFTVDSVGTFSKDGFPSERVYGDTPDAQLRLITCGGVYDKNHGGYRSNVVVFAHLSSYRPATPGLT
jgi:Sortase domain